MQSPVDQGSGTLLLPGRPNRHVVDVFAGGDHGRAAGWDDDVLCAGAIGAEDVPEDAAGFVGGLHHHGSGSVAEEHVDRAVFGFEPAADEFSLRSLPFPVRSLILSLPGPVSSSKFHEAYKSVPNARCI